MVGVLIATGVVGVNLKKLRLSEVTQAGLEPTT